MKGKTQQSQIQGRHTVGKCPTLVEIFPLMFILTVQQSKSLKSHTTNECVFFFKFVIPKLHETFSETVLLKEEIKIAFHLVQTGSSGQVTSQQTTRSISVRLCDVTTSPAVI